MKLYNRVSAMALGGLLLGVLHAAAQTAAPTLFDPATVASERTPSAPEVLRARAAIVKGAEIEASAARWTDAKGATTERLSLNLFDGTSVTAVLDVVEKILPGRTSWVGHTEEDEGSVVVLAAGEGLVAGTVLTGSRVFEIGVTDGEQRIRELDPALIPACQGAAVPPALGSGSKAFKAGGDSGLLFDLLVVYTPEAKSRAGGQSGIDNQIVSTVSVMNQGLARSGVVSRVRLVGAAEVDYVESGLSSVDLERLQLGADGFMDEVHALRDEKGADFVQLFVSSGGGRAFLMAGSNNPRFAELAFGVAGPFPNVALHELGHNLGCNHALGQSGLGIGAFPYSFSFVEPGEFTMVMTAHPLLGHAWLINFSNPAVTLNGFTTGTADQDNARSINGIRTVAANFRQSVPGVCPWAVGHPRYCADCGLCFEGEGDCDGDAQCAGSLVCVDDVGANYGFAPGIDVCELNCPWPPGHGRFCLDCGPCFAGQGDCDDDSQCLAGLTCRDNVGPSHGFGSAVDVCEEPCAVPVGDPDYCALCGPCTVGEGDCDAGQCLAGLACSPDVGASYGFTPGTDVCEVPAQVLQLTPIADAYAAQHAPNTNFGNEQALRVRFSASALAHYSFLKFDVPALAGTILSAKLRLRTQETAIGEAGFYAADLAPWTETGITWNNWESPLAPATYLRSLTQLAPDLWHTVDVSEAVTASGVVTIGIASGSDLPNQDFWSRESAWAPVLIVTHQP